jgi:hypothetical protein
MMRFTLPHGRAGSSPEVEFWTWFQKNEAMLFNFERDRERVFEELRTAMRKVHPDLTFEFGPIEQDRREFVISADGIKTAFPFVESLYASAPSLPQWTFIKFRPRRTPMELQVGDLHVKPGDMEVSIEADGSKAGLTVFLRGYDKARENQFLQAAFIMLDQAIGEYDMETKVGFIEVKPFEHKSRYQRLSLETLPAVFNNFVTR